MTARLPAALLGLLMLGAFAVLMHVGRDTTFNADDWNFVLDRRDWTTVNFFFPHNEHLSVVPVFVYKVLFETVGLGSYWVYRAILALLVLACGALVFAWSRPRVGAWAALGAAACVLYMGVGWVDMIWAFQIGFTGSLVFGLAALVVVDRRTDSRRSDIAAFVLLCLSLGSTTLGLCFAIAIGIDFAFRGRRRALWVPIVPVLLYGIWYLKYGISTSKIENLLRVPTYILDGLDDSAGALVGVGPEFGFAFVVVVAWFAGRRFIAPGPLPGQLIAVASLPLLFFGLAALSRVHLGVPADSARYIFPGAVLFLLVAVEALRSRDVAAIPPRVQGLACVALLVGAVAGVSTFEGNAAPQRESGRTTEGTLTALELLGPDRVERNALPVYGQPQVTAERYFGAIDDFDSSPALTETELRTASPSARLAADLATLTLTAGSEPLLRPAPGRPAGCAPLPPELEIPRQGVIVRAGRERVEVRLARYRRGRPKDPNAVVDPGTTQLLRPPTDRSPRLWRATFRSSGGASICPAA